MYAVKAHCGLACHAWNAIRNEIRQILGDNINGKYNNWAEFCNMGRATVSLSASANGDYFLPYRKAGFCDGLIWPLWFFLPGDFDYRWYLVVVMMEGNGRFNYRSSWCSALLTRLALPVWMILLSVALEQLFILALSKFTPPVPKNS